MSSRTLRKVPRWIAWRSMIPNQTSTRLSHDAEVGVKCTWMRGFSASQSTDLDAFVSSVVVHHQVNSLLGVGAGDLLEEAQELLVAVAVWQIAGDLAGGNL